MRVIVIRRTKVLTRMIRLFTLMMWLVWLSIVFDYSIFVFSLQARVIEHTKTLILGMTHVTGWN